MQQMIFDAPYARDRSQEYEQHLVTLEFQPVDFAMPKPGKPIESKADEIAEDYMSEIND